MPFKDKIEALRKGEHTSKGVMVMDSVFELLLFFFLGSTLLGAGITAWFATNHTTWDATTVTIWLVVPVIGVAILVYNLYKMITHA